MEKKLIKPKLLRTGDTIAILAPSSGLGAVFYHRVEMAIKSLTNLGFKVKKYPSCKLILEDGSSMNPEERAKELNNAFSDPDVKAIMAIIGGLYANSLLQFLDYEMIRSNPDRKSTRLNSSHVSESRMPSSA